MTDFIVGVAIGVVVVILLSPYFCLWNLKDIASELKNIREILEKETGSDE